MSEVYGVVVEVPEKGWKKKPGVPRPFSTHTFYFKEWSEWRDFKAECKKRDWTIRSYTYMTTSTVEEALAACSEVEARGDVS